MKCPICNTEYEGNFCPNGCNSAANPVQAPAPKKKKNGCLIAFIVVAIVAVIIVGIVVASTALLAKGVSDAVDEVFSTQSADYTAASYGMNEAGTCDGVKITVTKVERSDGSEFDKPDSGKEYVIVTVKIENTSSEKKSYNPYDFKMSNSQGQCIDNAFTTIDSDTSLQSGDLNAGGKIEGTIAFEQPKGDNGLVLEYYNNTWLQEKPSMEFKLN